MEKITLFNQSVQRHLSNMGQYFSNVFNNVYSLWESIIGKDAANFISEYLKENYKFYLGIGGFIGFVCVLKYFFKTDVKKAPSSSSSSTLSASGKKIQNRSVKSRIKSIKFMSETEQNDAYQNNSKNIKNDSTCSSSKGQKRESQKKRRKKKEDKYQEFEDQLQNQIQKVKTQRIVLQDSMSDKIFNEMYGVYMQT